MCCSGNGGHVQICHPACVGSLCRRRGSVSPACDARAQSESSRTLHEKKLCSITWFLYHKQPPDFLKTSINPCISCCVHMFSGHCRCYVKEELPCVSLFVIANILIINNVKNRVFMCTIIFFKDHLHWGHRHPKAQLWEFCLPYRCKLIFFRLNLISINFMFLFSLNFAVFFL